MSETSERTTKVEIVIEGRPATIADLQDALDTFRAEGIPEALEVDVRQSEDREYAPEKPYAERAVFHTLRISATRTAKAAPRLHITSEPRDRATGVRVSRSGRPGSEADQ